MAEEQMLEVKMKVAVRVYPDGIHPVVVSIGQVISLPTLLAEGLIRDSMAVTVSSNSEEDKRKAEELQKQQDEEDKRKAEAVNKAKK